MKTEFEQRSLPGATFEKTARVGTQCAVSAAAESIAGRELPGDARPVGGGEAGSASAMALGLCAQWARAIERTTSSLPPNELNGAMQGDEVLVEEAPPGRDGRRSGRIARVLTRRNPTVVGIFHYGARTAGAPRRVGGGAGGGRREGNYVTPLDERMTGFAGRRERF